MIKDGFNLSNKLVFKPVNSGTNHIDVFKYIVLEDMSKLDVQKITTNIFIKRGISSFEKNNAVVIRWVR